MMLVMDDYIDLFMLGAQKILRNFCCTPTVEWLSTRLYTLWQLLRLFFAASVLPREGYIRWEDAVLGGIDPRRSSSLLRLFFHVTVRVDEGRNSWSLLVIKMKARTVVGRGRRACLVTLLDLSYV